MRNAAHALHCKWPLFLQITQNTSDRVCQEDAKDAADEDSGDPRRPTHEYLVSSEVCYPLKRTFPSEPTLRYTHNVPDHAQDDPKAAHSPHRPCHDQRTALGKLDDSACEKGGVTREQLADALKFASGRSWHWNDCNTSCAPAEEPTVCNCAELEAHRLALLASAGQLRSA